MLIILSKNNQIRIRKSRFIWICSNQLLDILIEKKQNWF